MGDVVLAGSCTNNQTWPICCESCGSFFDTTNTGGGLNIGTEAVFTTAAATYFAWKAAGPTLHTIGWLAGGGVQYIGDVISGWGRRLDEKVDKMEEASWKA